MSAIATTDRHLIASAILAATGLGKSRMQLEWARRYCASCAARMEAFIRGEKPLGLGVSL